MVACFILVMGLRSLAQKTESGNAIELVQADKGEFEKRISAKKLLGNVILKNGNILMYCDSAYIFNNNTADAWGHVRMLQGDSINATGDKLHYDSNIKLAHLTGDQVVLADKTINLVSTDVDLDLLNNVATYGNGATITSEDNRLTSNKGKYFTKRHYFEFNEKVVLTNVNFNILSDTLFYETKLRNAWVHGPSTITGKNGRIACTSGLYQTQSNMAFLNQRPHVYSGTKELVADSIFFDQKAELTKSFKNVYLTDTAQHTWATGGYLEDSRKYKYSLLTDHPLFAKADLTDTLYLKGDTLKAEKDSAQRFITAYHHVLIFKKNLQGRCDSMSYTFQDSTIQLFNQPVLWSSVNQMTAKFIAINLANNQISNVHLMQAAFIVSRQDSDKFNQIKGKTMDATFANNELYKVVVKGNGQTIYYAKDKSTFVGVNKADCSSLLLYMKLNQIDKISFVTKPEATLFPMHEIAPKDLILKDFKWMPEDRPTLQKILN